MFNIRITKRNVIIGISIFLVLCALIGVIAYSAVVIIKDAEQKRAYENEIEPLIKQRSQLSQQYTHAEDLIKEKHEDIPNSNITLLFLGVQSEIFTDIYPSIAQKTSVVKGTLCLTADTLPGDEGCITIQQLDDLLSDGWSLALLFEGSGEDELSAFLVDVRQRLATLGIQTPDTLACRPGSYSPKLDDFILQEGFLHVIHNAEEQTPRIDKTVDSELFHPGAVGWRADNMQRFFMAELMQYGGCACFTIDLDGKNADTNLDLSNDSLVTSFNKMIEAIDGWAKEGLCTAQDVAFGLKNRQIYVKTAQIIEAEVKELREQIEKQLDEIEVALAVIYDKYR